MSVHISNGWWKHHEKVLKTFQDACVLACLICSAQCLRHVTCFQAHRKEVMLSLHHALIACAIKLSYKTKWGWQDKKGKSLAKVDWKASWNCKN